MVKWVSKIILGIRIGIRNIIKIDTIIIKQYVIRRERIRTGLTDRSAVRWNDYVQTMSFQDYETVVISLGANDGIGANQVTSYQQKATRFIRQIQQSNPSASIIWILPPTMKNPATEAALVNTRKAIRLAVYETQIASFDPEVAIGRQFTLTVNDVQVRTQDGIHYTSKGSDLIIGRLFSH